MKSTAELLGEFRFTDADRETLGALLGKNQAAVREEASDPTTVFDALESASRQYLVSSFKDFSSGKKSTKPADLRKRKNAAIEELVKCSKIILDIEKRHNLVSKLTTFEPGFWKYPGIDENFGDGDGLAGFLTDGQALRRVLNAICENSTHDLDDNSDEWWDSENSPILIWVAHVIREWSDWTCKVPGRSKNGGPAAFFVQECMSPVARYWTSSTGDSRYIHPLKPKKDKRGENAGENAGYYVSKAMRRFENLGN